MGTQALEFSMYIIQPDYVTFGVYLYHLLIFMHNFFQVSHKIY